ncbi:potassium channel family protein [Oerskovia flava]|uniref:potassium channel family protein n=1 Tax=Oerskovia flava TaxID=2986422 RepID=UPI002240238A|nr:potassium channel family protein [Oerskovia sp. JB1-3-2]
MRRIPHDSPWWTVIATAGSVVSCVLVFYGLPLGDDLLPGPASAVVFGVGVLALTWLMVILGRRQMRASADASVQVQSVVGLFFPIIVFFAIVYYLLAVDGTGQFEGIESRTDALYYTVVTLGTVGFGDIHPTGDAAKVVTMVQIIFDLAVVGVLLAVAATRAQGRVAHRDDARAQHRTEKS